MGNNKQLNDALAFVAAIRASFVKHGNNDLNDIPVDEVIEWADKILEGSK
jgi:hypothetical protein